MKKILQLTKAIILTLAAVIMLLNTNVLTAYAGTIMFPDKMVKTEDDKIMIIGSFITMTTDSTGKEWYIIDNGYPFCIYKEAYEVTKHGMTFTCYDIYLDCYLTDIIKKDDESKWPSFVVKGSDGIPFYYCSSSQYTDGTHYAKFCYDKESGWWIEDKAYKGPNIYSKTADEVAQETKTAIENGETINGAPVNPAPKLDIAVDSDDVPVTPTNPTEPEEPDNPPKEDEENKDPYADVNTLGATVTLKTDCIKVKTNKKGVVAQKPLPSSVKVDKKALKRNKTYTVSYEKFTDGWNTVDAVTDEGIYRLVITGTNGYEGVYKKRLYVTADKTIKAMSSVSVKVNKVDYTGKAIESGVIKTAKIGKRTLVEGEDYTVTYKNNTDSGIGQVILTAKENSGLLGTKTVNFTITGNKITKAKVSGIDNLTYSPGTDLVQDMSAVKLTCGTAALVENTDFTVSYVNNSKAGTAKIVFTGKGLYNGTLTKTFKINKAALRDTMLDEASKSIKETYTGKAIKPDVTLNNGDIELKKGIDYTLTYKNNIKVSTDAKPAQITVKGKGNYTGSFNVDFTVIAKDNDNTGNSNAKSIKPDSDEATADEAVTDEPTEDEPAIDEPTENEPVADEPTEDEPVTDEPTENEPVTDEPTEDDPATDEPTEDDPVTDEPTEDDPVTNEPIENEPATDESTVDEITANEDIIADIDTETASTVETTAQ